MTKKRKQLRTIWCKYCDKEIKTRYDNKEFCDANCKGKWHYQQGRIAIRSLVKDKLEEAKG